jgi:hypothetical protein
MSGPHDITGARFGRLLALEQSGWHPLPSGKRMPVWRCVCDCGREVKAKKPYLTSGDTKSCGCLRSETTGRLKLSHGLSHSGSTYDIWVLMRQRCNNPLANGYRYYGGRGIKVCQRWGSYEAFLSDMGKRPDGLTLDREDPEGDYEPGNCRWATWQTQNTNKRKAA